MKSCYYPCEARVLNSDGKKLSKNSYRKNFQMQVQEGIKPNEMVEKSVT